MPIQDKHAPAFRMSVLLLLLMGLATLPVHSLSDLFLVVFALLLVLSPLVVPASKPFFSGLLTITTWLIVWFFGWLLFRSVTSGSGLDDVDNYSRWAISLLVVILLRVYIVPTREKALLFIVLTAFAIAGVAMIVAFYQAIFIGAPNFGGRAFGNTNPLPFSEMLLASSGIFALALWSEKRPIYDGLFAVWMVLSVYAVSMTGTRGTFIAIFPLLLGLLIISILRKEGPKRLVLLTALLVISSLMALYDPRTTAAIIQYSESAEGSYVGSVGLRMEMWSNAIELIKAKPVIGHGIWDYGHIASQFPDLEHRNYSHVHNQMLDIWMKLGIIGLVPFLILHLYPILISGTRIIRGEVDITYLIAAWIAGAFLIFGGTQAYMAHSNTSLYFTFHLIFIMSLIKRAPK